MEQVRAKRAPRTDGGARVMRADRMIRWSRLALAAVMALCVAGTSASAQRVTQQATPKTMPPRYDVDSAMARATPASTPEPEGRSRTRDGAGRRDGARARRRARAARSAATGGTRRRGDARRRREGVARAASGVARGNAVGAAEHRGGPDGRAAVARGAWPAERRAAGGGGVSGVPARLPRAGRGAGHRRNGVRALDGNGRGVWVAHQSGGGLARLSADELRHRRRHDRRLAGRLRQAASCSARADRMY